MPVGVKFMQAHCCISSVSLVTQVTKRHMSRVTFEYCVIQLSYSTYVCVCLIILLRSDVQMVKVWSFTSLLSVSHQCDRLWLTPSDNHAVRLLLDILWSQAMITFPFKSFLIFLLIPTEKAYRKIHIMFSLWKTNQITYIVRRYLSAKQTCKSWCCVSVSLCVR